ncbi:MAG: HdeD family acid-resistance protein [Gaiellaceae bacterium]
MATRGQMAYRVGIARGVLALLLGVAMILQPEKTSDNLATYMGAFWALTGVVSIRSALAGERTRGIPLVSGCAGVVAGLVVFFHERLDDVVAQSVLVWLLAIVILLTGLAHLLAGFSTGDELERQRSRSSVLLGMMEIALGLLFLVGSLDNSRAAYWAAGIWALTGGVILIGDALLLRRRLRRQSRARASHA